MQRKAAVLLQGFQETDVLRSRMLEGGCSVAHIVEHQRDQRTEAVPRKPAAVDIAIPKKGEVAIGHEEGRRVLRDIRAGHQQG